jgi:hypothetical protein
MTRVRRTVSFGHDSGKFQLRERRGERTRIEAERPRELVRRRRLDLEACRDCLAGSLSSGSSAGASGSIPNASSTSATAVSGVAPLRSSRFEPADSDDVISPGTAKTSRPSSSARSAVISAPLRSRASTTTVAWARPATMRFRAGKRHLSQQAWLRRQKASETTPGPHRAGRFRSPPPFRKPRPEGVRRERAARASAAAVQATARPASLRTTRLPGGLGRGFRAPPAVRSLRFATPTDSEARRTPAPPHDSRLTRPGSPPPGALSPAADVPQPTALRPLSPAPSRTEALDLASDQRSPDRRQHALPPPNAKAEPVQLPGVYQPRTNAPASLEQPLSQGHQAP